MRLRCVAPYELAPGMWATPGQVIDTDQERCAFLLRDAPACWTYLPPIAPPRDRMIRDAGAHKEADRGNQA